MSHLIVEIRANTNTGVQWELIRERPIWDQETGNQCILEMIQTHVEAGIKVTVHKEGQFWYLETPGGTVTRLSERKDEEEAPTTFEDGGWKLINGRYIRVPQVPFSCPVPTGWEKVNTGHD